MSSHVLCFKEKEHTDHAGQAGVWAPSAEGTQPAQATGTENSLR